MQIRAILSLTALVLGVAACSPGQSVIGSGPQGVTSSAPNAASQAPQSVNSLPANTTVNAPLATGAGRVGTTAVPSRSGY